MVLFITYLCPSQLQSKKKKNKAKSTKQKLSRLSQTGRNQFCVSEQFSIRSQHFLNFSSKTSLPIQATNFSRKFCGIHHQKIAAKCTEMKEKMVEGTPLLLQKKHECNNNGLCCFS